MADRVDVHLELPAELAEKFVQTAEALGMSPAAALSLLVERFVEDGGFSFRKDAPDPRMNWDDPRIVRAQLKDGKVVVPASWRDEDDE